jgi:hypothetical protein
MSSRLLSWCESWIIEDASREGSRAERKRDETRRMQNAIESGCYDSDTLQNIIQLLDHECLCCEPSHDPELPITTSGLGTNWTSTILNQLSNRLVQAISPMSHFERELQSRALISALALLHAQDVNAFERSQYDLLFDQFKSRFQDLRMLRPASRDSPFTREKFRQFQSSYLLCSGAEYATCFRRAEPILITSLLRLADLFYVAASTAISVQTVCSLVPMMNLDYMTDTHTCQGSMAGSIPGTMSLLKNALRPLRRRPNGEYQVLFTLQQLTRKTVALHLVAKVKEMCERIDGSGKEIASAALRSSLDLAAAILDQILVALNQHNDFETTICPRSSLWEYCLAICDRGPPAMDTYFYLYGLLDCATQLGRILSYDRIQGKFKSRMMTIIRRSTEESYRWKAVSYRVRN